MRWSSWREELSSNGSDEQAGLRQILALEIAARSEPVWLRHTNRNGSPDIKPVALGIGSLCHGYRDFLGRSSPLWTCSESYSTIWITMSDNGLNLVFSS